MIKERFMVQGKRIADDVMIIGWLVITGHNEVTDSRGRYLRTDYCYQIEPVDYNEHRAVVYPETIGPVAANVKIERHRMNQRGDVYDNYDLVSYFCPNCDVCVAQQRFNGKKAVGEITYKQSYCDRCGQKLDWGDENE